MGYFRRFKVYLDHQYVGKVSVRTPLELKVPQGQHHLRVSIDGLGGNLNISDLGDNDNKVILTQVNDSINVLMVAFVFIVGMPVFIYVSLYIPTYKELFVIPFTAITYILLYVFARDKYLILLKSNASGTN